MLFLEEHTHTCTWSHIQESRKCNSELHWAHLGKGLGLFSRLLSRRSQLGHLVVGR